MKFEVEQKHRVADVDALVKRLRERGVEVEPAVEQSDQYFAHPARDFAKTDEALRVRTVGDKSFVTYKGPKVDTTTKTRKELELPLHADDADGSQFCKLLSALGFKPVTIVRKHRRKFEIVRGKRTVEGALDDVEGVGMFVELELLADESEMEDAKRKIRELADELKLGPTERGSYLEMLLESLRKT